MTESLIKGLLEHTRKLKDSTLPSLDIPQLAADGGQTGDSWKQVEFIPALEEALGTQLPDLSQPLMLFNN